MKQLLMIRINNQKNHSPSIQVNHARTTITACQLSTATKLEEVARVVRECALLMFIVAQKSSAIRKQTDALKEKDSLVYLTKTIEQYGIMRSFSDIGPEMIYLKGIRI